ncbi:MAG: VWA domain-containing protein [Candidatus Wallbacteria bacterium]|nr:VWA domain-containing protein [Candidatus Wallbacteria bacterium]
MILSNWKLIFIFLPMLFLVYWKIKRGNQNRGLRFNLLFRISESYSKFLRRFPQSARILLLLLGMLALMRPQLVDVNKSFSSEGINIMLLLDVSGSMQAKDFSPNRFEAARSVLKQFISGRKNDRIGLVVFSGESYTACPLTIDYDILLDFLDATVQGKIADGTAIGDALGTAISHIRKAPGKTKVAILLTDGENNAGSITPAMAADWARDDKIKVYTIGVGSEAGATIAVTDQYGRVVGQAVTKLDEELLRKIAETTDGKYYHATDNRSLAAIYQEIDQLEKTTVTTKIYYNYNELFPWLIWGMLLIWALIFYHEEIMLRIP